jgi:hypothetical protein
MKEVERMGLLKMDFLGLSTLTLIRDALDEIKHRDRARHRRVPLTARRPSSSSAKARPTGSSSSKAPDAGLLKANRNSWTTDR